MLARVRLGTALLTAGVTDAAAEQFEAATRLPLPPPETWTLLARARLRQTLTLPAPRRDWDRVEALLDRAGANAGQAVPVALLRADVRVAHDRPADAEAVLAKACAKLRGTPDVDRLWAARARLAARLGQSRRAAEVLDEARAALGDSAELRLAEARVPSRSRALKTVAFLRSQETGLDRFKPADRARVVAAPAAAHYRVGNRADGDRLTRGLVVGLKNPSVDDWVRLLDLALQGNDDGLVTEVAAGLKKLEGEKSGSWWRYAEAARLVVKAMRGDRAGMAEARAAPRPGHEAASQLGPGLAPSGVAGRRHRRRCPRRRRLPLRLRLGRAAAADGATARATPGRARPLWRCRRRAAPLPGAGRPARRFRPHRCRGRPPCR